MDKSKDFLRVTDAAAMLGVDYKTVYRLIRNGKLPASKPGGVYLIRLADVNRLLEQGQVALTSTEESPLATEVLRCGQCLRLIESDAQIGGVCERESCEEILCAACWLPQNENFCHKHLPTREQRYEAARKEFAAGRLPALASAREARQMEMNFLSRFDHKVRQIATLKNPLNNSLYKNLNWDAAHTQGDAASEVMSLLNSGFLDAATLAAVPLNAYSTYSVSDRHSKLILEARVLSRLRRHIAEGFDAAPMAMGDLLPPLTEVIKSAEKNNTGCVIGFASVTGWEQEAVEYAASSQPGKAFSHRLALPYLVDLKSGHVHRNVFDPRIAALASLFAVMLPEEELEQVARAIKNALTLGDSLTLAQAMAETHAAESVVRQAFDRLATGGSFVVVEAPNVGLAITRS